MTERSLSELGTPALLLRREQMMANIDRMRRHVGRLNVSFRPHVKTAKCIEVALAMSGGTPGPITVSTLREADYFADHGYTDILYAVGIAANKLAHVAKLQVRGVRMTVILDSVAAAQALVESAGMLPAPLHVLIEIDCDGHRSGVPPDGGALLPIAAALSAAGADRVVLDGVMTHAGASYECRDPAALRAMAERERAGVVRAAERLRAAGHPAPVVSVGSTPTALFAEDLSGVTEVRAGVFVFFDLVMAGIGVCTTGDVAVSVLTTVIGHQRDKGWAIVDAGWMAMSRDRGTAAQDTDQGYGLVCDLHGVPIDDYIMVSANQEHGIIAHRSGNAGKILDAPVGTMLRILPNHACATAAQHDRYQVLDRQGQVTAEWPRFSGW